MFVRTRERNYNNVDSAELFKTIRDSWQDYSEAVRAFDWVDGEGWVDIDPTPFNNGGRQRTETVPADAQCPDCHESRMDWLVWQDDDTVTCTTCGCKYEV